ncbi:DUF1698 domain-containing protein [Methylobacterium organophilum]|uniref:DUF1698 domain-containing protein n=1 Tax=Methylobacterium organophilum TaxID=410 RepID=UPI001EE2815A|nr:DUF1698 domain-containing protein [Methylobacterium organophilum]
MQTEQKAEDAAGANIRWFHSYNFPDGEKVRGRKPPGQLEDEARKIFTMSLSDRTVLDIGAWDGYFSFEAEKRGAKSVLATDHFCWSGPGWGTKDGFNYAHSKLGSKIESKDIDLPAINPGTVGIHDVTLFLGVLYHLRDPLGGLAALSHVTREIAVIETVVDEMNNPNPVLRYFLGKSLNNDPTNYFAPNLYALEDMCREVGFRTFSHQFTQTVRDGRGRILLHAFK